MEVGLLSEGRSVGGERMRHKVVEHLIAARMGRRVLSLLSAFRCPITVGIGKVPASNVQLRVNLGNRSGYARYIAEAP